MKRFISIALCLMILVASLPVSAAAAGKGTVTQENFFVEELWGYEAVAYARVENTGDKPIEFSAGLLEVFNADGDTLASDTYFNVYGDYMQPGEYCYVAISEGMDDVEDPAEVDDYSLTVSTKSSSGTTCKRFACETEWLPDFEDGWWTYDYMVATFTNDTDETVFDIEVVLVLLDEEGNILYIDSVSLYDNIGVAPASTVTVRETVSSYAREAFEAAGFTPAYVDAIAYVYIEE